MKLAILPILVVAILMFASTDAQKPVICYFGSWTGAVDRIRTNICTHVMYGFFHVDSAGSVADTNWDPSILQRTIALKPSGVKVLASIGGWNDVQSNNFGAIASDPNRRANFANNCLRLCQERGLDGIDIDWEYPRPEQKDQFTELIRALSNVLRPAGKLLMIATSADPNKYNMVAVQQYLDMINVMTYDFHWDNSAQTGYTARLSSVDSCVSRYLSAGAPANKIALGVPFYGVEYALSSLASNGAGASASIVSTMDYSDVCRNLANGGWASKTDADARQQYMVQSTRWVSYDDPQSITDKVQYASSKGLGAIMIWSVEKDDFEGKCGQGAYPLMNAIHSAWHDTPGPTAPPTVASTPRPTVASTPRPTVASTPRPTAAPTTRPTAPSTAAPTVPSGSGNSVVISICSSTGIFGFPNDCTKYYNCGYVNYPPYVMTCSGGTFFDPATKACGWTNGLC